MFLNAPTPINPATFVQLYPRSEGWFTGAGQISWFTSLLERSKYGCMASLPLCSWQSLSQQCIFR